jgi:hypothetical protein
VTRAAPVPDRGVPAGVTRNTLIAVGSRPHLWWTAVTAVLRLASPGWWRRASLPVPDPRLWSFRMVTMYGEADAEPSPRDVVAYLEWCRSTRRSRTETQRGERWTGDRRANRRCG